MIVKLNDMKKYLRVDTDDDNKLIRQLIQASEQICMDVLRTNNPSDLESAANIKTAMLYAVAYLYEHREEADHHELTLTLRAILFGERKAAF